MKESFLTSPEAPKQKPRNPKKETKIINERGVLLTPEDIREQRERPDWREQE